MCGGVEQKAHESHAAASRSVKTATEASKTARAAMSGPGEQPLVDTVERRRPEVTVGAAAAGPHIDPTVGRKLQV